MQELQQRWYALLYDPIVSRVAVAAMRNLHPEVTQAVQAKALFSKAEEELLGTIKSVRNFKNSPSKILGLTLFSFNYSFSCRHLLHQLEQ